MKSFVRTAVCAMAATALANAGAAERHAYAETREGVSGPQQVVDAINASAAGDTVVVHPGTYDFTGVSMASGAGGVVDHLSVSKALNIRGETEGRWTDDVTFTGPGRAINLAADVAFTVSGITFEGFGGGSGSAGAVAFKSDWAAGDAAHGDGTYMSNCVIRGCTAAIAGGVRGGLAYDCLFETNSAASYTGAAQNTRVIGCTFRGNTASNYYGALENPRGCFDCLFEGNAVSQYAGALSFNGNYGATVSNCTFRGNVTRGNIGTVGIEGALTVAPVFIGCTFEANRGVEGSAIGVRRSHAAIPLVGCTFRCNTNDISTYVQFGSTLFACPENGETKRYFKSGFQARDCHFERNYSICVGGVASAGAFTNCTFAANLSDFRTSETANYLAGDSFRVGDGENLDLKACTFRDHRYNVGNYGGAVGVTSNGTCRIADCRFVTNTHTYGAAIYVARGGACRVSGSTFLANSCNNVGGAVYVEPEATALFSNCWFEANACPGGAAVRGGTYRDCTFTNHLAEAGVAVEALVEDSRFTGNHTDGGGNRSCDAENCRLVRCDLDGGSICLCSLESCRIHDVDYSRNRSLCVFFNANWVTNCLIDHCYGKWGLIYSNRGSRSADTEATKPEWVNCTFADNCFWQWYGFYCHDPAARPMQLADFENCIFSGNRRQPNADTWTGEGEICDFCIYQNLTPAGVTLRNCLWGRILDGSHCTTNFTNAGGNVPGADPKFARGKGDLAEYAIPRGSPARNAGVTRGWHAAAKDLAGNDRLFEERVDIGCYECNIPRRGMFLIFR